ncbi:non-specific lipid transfer protein GPI-anchored 29-like [Henckelia pumila]|uniref:non-specific lipid transfer protein GPI-anchored 29-like n=1 Tax=Henckelia pumila TaxID=405737 RepID=UPI003C6E42D2
MKLFIVCCILALWAAAAAAQAPASSPSPSHSPVQPPGKSEPEDCSTLVYNMIDCLTYITKGSNETKPDDSCCSGFKSVVKGNAECICVALNSSESLGIYIDVSRARKLSSFCHVSPNPVDKCKAKPSPSPPKSSPKPPHHAAKPPAAPKAQHKAPAPAPGKSGAHAISATPSFILVTLFCLSFYRVLA